MTKLNWNQIRKDIQEHTDLEKLKKELVRLQAEIKKLNVRAFLSPAASKRLKQLESKYAEVLRGIHRAQRQIDREVNRFLRKFKATRTGAEKKFEGLYDFAMTQKAWIEQLLKKKSVTKKKTTKKKVTRKKTKRS